jgi:cellulose synthase/poly-beta-1,6-N-acetylglucosamine synthase-like glycosyltransferase
MFEMTFLAIPFTVFLVAAWVFLLATYGYNISLSFLTLKKGRTPKTHLPKTKFAIVVPAHNEAAVIKDLLGTLNLQNYPKELYDIFVVADNCSDDTYKIAKENGAIAFNRKSRFKGKGYALRYVFKRLFNHYHERNYEAVCIIDSDNLVDSNFLAEMNNALCEGQKIIQGNLGVKNPNDNWVTKAIAGSYYVTNSLWQNNKCKIGLSASCGGTGFCVSSEILKKYGWQTESLVEDLEFEILMAKEGEKIYWCNSAKVYDEKPSSIKDAYIQRVRWLKGHLSVLIKQSPKLFRKFLVKHDVNLLDKMFTLTTVLFYGTTAFVGIIWGISLLTAMPIFTLPLEIGIFLNISLFIYSGAGVYCSTKQKKDLTKIIWMYIFSFIWIAAFFGAIFTFKDKRWSHTPHTVTSTALK